jgi:hypothetical protein
LSRIGGRRAAGRLRAPASARRVARRLRPLALPAPLLALAMFIGGVPGVILGWVAVLLGIDRLLERLMGAGSAPAEADRTFKRLQRERRRAERRHASAPLEYLHEDEGRVALARRRALGVQPIPVASIAGTVDPHKAQAFDRALRPPHYSRGRWTLMFRAAAEGAQMPPISVYRIGESHYVRDGHHRASVARARGADEIEAEVVELSR